MGERKDKIMRKFLFLAVTAAMVLATVPASASRPSPFTSTFAVVSLTPTDTRTANGNTFTTATRLATLSGTFTGTTTDTLTIVMHSNGTTSVRGTGVCECTVEGRSGTFEYRFEGKGIFPTSGAGRFVARHGTGGLEGIHAQGTFSGDFFVATVRGRYHFD